MKFLLKFALKTVVNAAVLYVLHRYLAGFIIYGDYASLLIAGAVLAFISTVIRPIVRVITAPIVWLTLGLFNIVINVGLLLLADRFLLQVEIHGIGTLIIASFALSLANAFF